MDALDISLCCGCLSAGRKMIAINEFRKKQCFLQIIREIPMCEPEEVPLWLCWECTALVRRFTDFKQQVKYSYQTLQEIGKQNLNTNQLHQPPKLSTHKLYTFNSTEIDQSQQPESQQPEPLQPDIIQSEPLDPQPIKIEVKIETKEHIKTELDSDHYYGEDLLTELPQKKKKRNVKKKKKEVELFKEIVLTEQELEEERRQMGLREEYVNAMFRCEKCLVSFPNADDLNDHVRLKHELNAAHFSCPICTCSFVSEISYNYHSNKHRRRFECAACGARAASKRAAQRHHDAMHGINPSYADHTNQENDQTDCTTAVTNGGKPDAMFPCEQCAKSFRWKTSLRKHLETHRIAAGQKRRPYCEPCKLSFTTTSNLQKHVKTSSKHQIQLKLRKLKESLPEESTSAEKHQAHIEEIKCSVNSARQQFPCAHCGKRFQWRGNLLRHLHSHAARANGELVCAPCDRTFSSIATYKQHMLVSRRHVSEQQLRHACAECGRRFATRTRLRDHEDWDHRRLFRHACDNCQKVFKSHTSLYLHKQVVHKKDHAEHLCDHCGKPFPNHAKLRSHIIALHTAESPYRCSSCPARFSWHSCLSRHVRRVHKRT